MATIKISCAKDPPAGRAASRASAVGREGAELAALDRRPRARGQFE